MLTLPEELLLLGLNDEKGSVVSAAAMGLPYGLTGTVLMELAIRGRISVEGETVSIISTETTPVEFLDEALRNIAQSPKKRKADWWIARPASLVKKLGERLKARLVEAGILRDEEHKFLWVFPYHRYPAQDARPEHETRRRIHDVILRGATADEHIAVLICMLHACGLAKEVFPDQKPKEIALTLKAFSEADQVSRAVSNQVAAATMAAVTSAISTSMMATTMATMNQ